ncbi:hypothetical protein AV530_016153 [Patagioenas fasciata monilis]|uniref:Uncharacterized protein n=1 Tax=Patagioenas fasciata monilis TaxID=372326 RepID=A0A1V4JWL7_PATFA|nr:hypothetical protein AV530_016153 [Patagioenas fasciata monilis]
MTKQFLCHQRRGTKDRYLCCYPVKCHFGSCPECLALTTNYTENKGFLLLKSNFSKKNQWMHLKNRVCLLLRSL